MSRFATLALLALLVAGAASAQTTVTVTADVSSSTTWSASNEYLLDGLIFVRPGATLTIEPGTVVRGKAVPSTATGDLASGLIVMVGARIEADGRADAPIIMTAEADDLSDPTDLDQNDRAEWGGLILLGRATTNSTPGINFIEGVPESDDTRFGCDASTAGFACDDDDDSGILRYVSLRHAGFGFRADSEINGMTFGAVGRGTTVEYVEVFANSDDNFEFFGGTVEVKYAVGAFSGDDTFDTDRGFRGKFQFGLSVNNPGNDAGRCFENDGGVSDLGGEDAQPYAVPVYSNITCIGAGRNANQAQLGEEGNSATLQLRDNTGGKIYNSIFVDWPGSALNLEALSSGEDTENRFGNNVEGTDDLIIANNIFFGFGAGSTFAAITDNDSDNSAARQTAIEAALAAQNLFVDPQLVNLSGRAAGSGLDPRPRAGSPAAAGAVFTGNALAGDSFFEPVAYKGAFAPADSEGRGATWLAGWTALDAGGYLSGQAVSVGGGPEAGALGLAVGPNPTRGGATARVTLAQAGPARLALYDVLGREVAVVAEGAFAAGTTLVTVDAGSLPAGAYVLRLTAEGAAATTRLSVVR